MLRLDFWNLLFTVINLIVLYLLLKHFLIKPVTAIMEKRKSMIEEGISNANQMQAAALEMKQNYEDIIGKAKEESDKIADQALKNAKFESDKIISEADIQAGRILKTARETINLEREQALRDMKSQVAGLAVDAAKKLIGSQGSFEGNQAIYDQFLEEAGETHDAENH